MTDKIDTKNSETQKLPNQKEIEKELSEYLSKKYGDRIKIISPFLMPKGQEASTDEAKGKINNGDSIDFDMLPEELEAYLDTFIIKQRHAKAVLSTKICTHFNRIKYLNQSSNKRKNLGVGMIKNNVLMIGPTGVGKTYMLKLIAQKLGVPMVKGDATKFSETGYVGGDVEDLVRDLVHEANDDINLAENGIIYIDEIDKIASAQNIIGHDVSRTGVQRALLKPMEETDVDLKVAHDAISQIQAIEHYRRTGKKEKQVVNTKNILFIMSGAFGDLAEIIRKRLQKQGIGFEADVRSTEVPWEILKEVTAQDLIEFGFETEFVGRMPVIVVFDELTKEDLVEILKNPNNPVLLSKRQDFRAYGIDLKFEHQALEKIAEMAAASKTGARGLVGAVEKVLIPFEKKLPSTSIKQLLVTPELVENAEAELCTCLESHKDPRWIERFERATRDEIRDIKAFINDRSDHFRQVSDLNLYDSRIDLIARLYLKTTSDINMALDDFAEMVKQIKSEEATLTEKLEVDITFDDSAVDELVNRSIETGLEAGSLAFQLTKKIEYGLKLVRDRSGISRFLIDGEAVRDVDGYINAMVKNTYKSEYSPGYVD